MIRTIRDKNRRITHRLAWWAAALLLTPALTLAAAGGQDGVSLGELLPLWSTIPFVGILLSIAIMPLLAPACWHHHFGKLPASWAL